MIYKVSTSTTTRNHLKTILSIIGVKRERSMMAQRINFSSMELAKGYCYHDPELQSHLLAGNQCSTVWLQDDKMEYVRDGQSLFGPGIDYLTNTGGEGSLTQQVHCEFIVSSETICPNFTQQVHAGYFLKVPTNSPPKNPPGKV